MATPPTPEELQGLLNLAFTLRNTRYTMIATQGVLLWDTFITLSDEIDLIWKRVPRIGFIPIIYLLNKYISLAFLTLGIFHVSELRDPISLQFCHIYLSSAVLVQLFTEILSKLILTRRLIALYNNDIWIKRSLWAVFISSYAVCLSVTVCAIQYNLGHTRISAIGDTCSVKDGPKVFAIILICPLLFELYMTFLTLKRAIGHAHALRNASSAPLLHVIYVEKILYFVAITAIRLALVYTLLNSRNVYLGIALLWALDVVLVSRFYLETAKVLTSYAPNSIWTTHQFTENRTGEQTELSVFSQPTQRSNRHDSE